MFSPSALSNYREYVDRTKPTSLVFKANNSIKPSLATFQTIILRMTMRKWLTLKFENYLIICLGKTPAVESVDTIQKLVLSNFPFLDIYSTSSLMKENQLKLKTYQISKLFLQHFKVVKWDLFTISGLVVRRSMPNGD